MEQLLRAQILLKKKKLKNVFYNFDDPDERTYKKAKIF